MKKEQYLEQLINREFYEFYKKSRRKPSKVIDQYNYFEKAIGGLIREIRMMMTETEHGIHLKGLGVLYRKPFGEYLKKLSLFTHTKVTRNLINFYLEDDYLRNQYLIANPPKIKKKSPNKTEDKATAILLHRKLKLKK
jgi:hypothetical protein